MGGYDLVHVLELPENIWVSRQGLDGCSPMSVATDDDIPRMGTVKGMKRGSGIRAHVKEPSGRGMNTQ